MDVVLNNTTFPGNSSVSEVKSGAKEGTRDSSRTFSVLADSSQATDTFVSQTKPVEETRRTEDKKGNDSEKGVSTPPEKNINVNDETLLKFRIEENENKETGEKSKELVVYLMDKKTGEVIRQIPPKDFYDQGKSDLPSSGIFINQEG